MSKKGFDVVLTMYDSDQPKCKVAHIKRKLEIEWISNESVQNDAIFDFYANEDENIRLIDKSTNVLINKSENDQKQPIFRIKKHKMRYSEIEFPNIRKIPNYPQIPIPKEIFTIDIEKRTAQVIFTDESQPRDYSLDDLLASFPHLVAKYFLKKDGLFNQM